MSDKTKTVAELGVFPIKAFQTPQPTAIKTSNSTSFPSIENNLIRKIAQLENMAERLHTGNVAHLRANILQGLRSLKNDIKEII